MFELSSDRPLIAEQVGRRSGVEDPAPTLSRSDKASALQMDWEHLHHLSDNNPEFELELLQLYLQDTAEQIALLKQAIAIQDAQQAGRLAHHLKGSSANVGVRALQQLAARLESCFEHQQFHTTEALLIEFERLLTELSALMLRSVG